MNTEKDLARRLLKLYPVSIVKEHFKKKGYRQDLIKDIVTTPPFSHVFNFAYAHINQTKQHIYLYKSDKNIDTHKIDRKKFPYKIEHEFSIAGIDTFIITPIVQYDIVRLLSDNTSEERQVSFYQPFLVVFKGDNLIIQAIKLEKNVSTLFKTDRRVFVNKITNNEEETVKNIVSFIGKTFPLEIHDVNKGIKYLVDNDTIDAIKIKSLSSTSAHESIMHKGLTLKKNDPNQYNTIKLDPFKKTIFSYVKTDTAYPAHFSCDPTNGYISIPRFPKNINQISNVVYEILARN